MSFFEIMKTIKTLSVKTQKNSKLFEKKNQENMKLKISLNILKTQIQKQS